MANPQMRTNDRLLYSFREVLKSRLAPAVFHGMQRAGLDVLPRHFYSEIPNIRRLRAATDWRRPLCMENIAGSDVSAQCRNASESMPDSVRELADRTDLHHAACEEAGYLGYGPIETQALVGFVVKHRPGSVVQVGCGVSTAAILRGAEIAGYRPRLTCIEPYPTDYLLERAAAGQIEIVDLPAQSSEMQNLADLLRQCDLLFVDSSHTLGPAGEVTRLIVEWLPQLRPGSFAHFHDVFFPYDYAPTVLSTSLVFWHETALLHAYLSDNPRFEIHFSMSMLQAHAAEETRRIYAGYQPCAMADNIRLGEGHYPSSVYLHAVG